MEQLPEPRRTLRLTAAEFARLARGPGTPATIGKLGRAQRSLTMLAIRRLAEQEPELAAPAALLGRAHETARTGVDALLDHPWLGIWAVGRIRGEPTGRPDYLPSAALAGAALAGWWAAMVQVRPWRGLVPVPGLGVLRADLPGTTLCPADLRGPRWVPLRRSYHEHGGLTLALTLDDVDPYRDSFGVPVAPRLTGGEATRLRLTTDRSWQLLVDRAPQYAAELAATPLVLVPLAGRTGSGQSITHADGFGAFAADPELSELDLAVTMVHEFQHSKLNALLRLVRLFDPADPHRYFAPWRRDPRPIGGLLHGIYAFAAVAEVWLALREPARDRAIEQFTVIRAQLDRGLRELTGAPGLTAAGHHFTDRLAARVAALLAVPVPAAMERTARTQLDRAERAWRPRA